jgi:hypothetical protein
MTDPDNETEKDFTMRTGGNIQTRESAPTAWPSSSDDNDQEQTGDNIQARETEPLPTLSLEGDDGPERER